MSNTASDANLILPTARQLEFQDWEFGLFLHFGIRSFYQGHRDWDDKQMQPAQFQPSQLDCGQWLSAARQAGMRYAIMTAKHHDGYCNWPSAYSDFTVGGSPWKDGQGDVVREFLDACRQHDVAAGLYYSPADWRNPDFKDDPPAFDEYLMNQLRELLTDYGDIDIVWFDGCGSAEHTYDWDRIAGQIRALQPNILIGVYGDPDYRWVGNEAGLAPLPCWNVVEAESTNSVQTTAAERQGRRWLPAECDCRMRYRNWFYSDSDEGTIKSVEELMGLYYYSVGRGANMLLNFGPDRRGLLPDLDTQRLLEFGTEIRRRWGSPLATLDDWKATEGGWELTREAQFLVDHVVLQEDLTQGERLRRFAVKINKPGREEVVLYEGQNVGHKAICRFPQVCVWGLTVEILESDGPVQWRTLEAHNSAGG